MTLFLLATAIVFLATGVCALVEAALYAVRSPYAHQLAESGNRSGKILVRFKDKMDYPISAILIFDTLLGVGGASIAGSQARAIFGPEFVIWFTVGLSVTLLIFAQIVPKILGVIYSKPVARATAVPVSIAIVILYPIVWLIERFTRFLKPDNPLVRASEGEVHQMAKISAAEGSILGIEADLIRNSLKLDDICAADIMTPMKDVFSLSSRSTVEAAFKSFRNNSHSRIPVFDPSRPTRWTHLIFSRDILFAMANDRFQLQLAEIARPIHFVPAGLAGHELLDSFLKRRSHLFGVQNDTGSPIGVVALEDVLEEILGQEIVDEKEATN